METKLKKIITERGLKQGFIAEKADVSRGAFSLIVRGKSIPTLPAALRIAQVLDMSVEELWGEYINEK